MTDNAGTGATRTVHDPFLGKDVEVSNRLTDRLRGRYANGPTMPNGEPEFGWREFPTPPIQREAADEIDRLRAIPDAAHARIRVTDDLVDRVLTENVDLIQGFSYETYHCIRDFRHDVKGPEIWRCPRSESTANHGVFQKQLQHEKLKAQLIAALISSAREESQ